MATRKRKLGLIVNPIAGMGGKVGLKGTDGELILLKARRLGAKPVSPTRAVRAIRKLAEGGERIEIVTCPGEMGADEVAAAGLKARAIGGITVGRTTAADTREAAQAMLDAKVDLLLFAGGDGTARDVFDVVGDRLPILGIPNGVKIHSAVFATSPENAGQLALLYLTGPRNAAELREAEVMDIDEDAMRDNRVSARLYGYASVPYQRALMQSAKSGATLGEDHALDALCYELVEGMEAGRLYVLGPGTTTYRIKTRLGIDGTLLGVDAVADRRQVGKDLNETQLLALVEGRPATIVVTVIGGQGYVFGRGNQQISAEVIRRVGKENIVVVVSMNKIMTLQGQPLLADTGDAAMDATLKGFIRVYTGPGRSTILPLAS